MEYMDRLYTQFLYKYNDIESNEQLEKDLFDAGFAHNVLISDLSSMNKVQRTAELNCIIASERSRFYYPGDPEYFLSIYKLTSSEYFFLLSVCDSFLAAQKESIDHMCHKLFHCLPAGASSIISETNYSHKDTLNYWSDRFAMLNPDNFKGIHRSNGDVSMVSFNASPDIEEAFDKFVEHGGSGSALCATVLGQMTSHMLNSPQVIVNQILTGTPLSSAPIVLNSATSYGVSLREVISQFKDVSTHCFCSRGELYHSIGNRFINRIMISTGYADSKMYTNLLDRMNSGTLYVQPAIDTLNSPLCVFTRRFEGLMTINYYFDSKAFESVDMMKFHDSVSALFEKALNVRNDSIPKANPKSFMATSQDNSSVAMSKEDELRLGAIKKLEIFRNYDEFELLAMLDSFNFTLRNSKQYIFAPKEKVDSVYFVLSGMVSVMGNNSEGFINPLFIAKPGDILGVEALTSDPYLKNIYQAHSENVILMSIKKDALIREISRHPEILQYILGKQIDISNRFQKLWLTI